MVFEKLTAIHAELLDGDVSKATTMVDDLMGRIAKANGEWQRSVQCGYVVVTHPSGDIFEFHVKVVVE